MENVEYVKTRESKYQSLSAQKEWFGMTAQLSSSLLPLYSDNSFAKHDYVQSFYDRKLQFFNKAFESSRTKVEKFRSHLHFSYITKKQLISIYNRKKNKRKLMEDSAIKIQKVIRGYLTRKKYQNELVTLTQKIVQIRVQGLVKTNNNFMFFLGKAPERAAKRLQNSVRRFLFRCKIEKYKKYYDWLLADRAEKIFSVIRKHVSSYACKLKILNIKFNQYREEKLFEIRRNLSILTVSKIFKKMRFTFKSIKHKINRYKRRLRNSVYDFPSQIVQANNLGSNFNMPQETLSPSHSSGRLSVAQGSNTDLLAQVPEVNLSPEIEEVSSSTSENERLRKESEQKRLEFERKERIRCGKISYCIRPKSNSPQILPYLYQKDIIEGLSIPSNYYNITRATASRISESRPKRYSPVLSKSRTPTPQIVFKSKRIIEKPVPLYKRETVAFKMSRWDADAENEENNVKPKITIKPRLNSKVLDKTFAFKQKINQKFEEKVVEIKRPNTNFSRKIVKYEKKINEPRPYTMGNSSILFNPV